MYVQFDASLNDLVDVCFRSQQRRRMKRREPLGRTVAIGLLTGLLLIVAVEDPLEFKIAVACIGAMVGMALYWLFYWDSVKRSVRTACCEYAGKLEPLHVEVELQANGLWVKMLGTETLIGWANVEEIKDSQDTVYFVAQPWQIVAVRRRAFSSEEIRLQFIELARRYVEQSRVGF